jgi:hypothetical protein
MLPHPRSVSFAPQRHHAAFVARVGLHTSDSRFPSPGLDGSRCVPAVSPNGWSAARISYSVSSAPQPQPHCIRGARRRLMERNAGPQIASRTRILHLRHWPEKQRSQNGYGVAPKYSLPQQMQFPTVNNSFTT